MSAVETLPANSKLPSKAIPDIRKPLWSDSEESDNESDKKDVPVKSEPDLERPKPESGAIKQKEESLLGPEFDSKWDRFPTSQEFKSIYGDAIWEQLQHNYNDLAKSLADITKKPEKVEDKKEKENRTTCWDALENKSDGKVDLPRGVGRPRESGEGSGRGRGGGRPPGRKPGETKNKVAGSLQCHHCDKSFDAIVQARPHLQVHSGIKPYKCSQCDYRSYSKHNVTNVHWSNKHGRKGTNDDVETDVTDKENLKSYVIKEAERMLDGKGSRKSDDAKEKGTADKVENKIETSGVNSKPDNSDSSKMSEKGSKETPPTKENDAKEENGQDEDDMDISEDVLDSLCAESDLDSSESKNSKSNNKNE